MVQVLLEESGLANERPAKVRFWICGGKDGLDIVVALVKIIGE